MSASQILGEVTDDHIKILYDHLNVREGPDTSYSVLGQANKGDEFPLLEEREDWIKIDFHGKEGWVSSEFTERLINSQQDPTPEQTLELTVPQNKVHIRQKPSNQAEIIKFVNKGENLSIVNELDDWYQVKLDQEDGYVYKSFMTSKPAVKANLLEGKTIVIDPGHGGYDVGAISVSGDYEKDLSLTTANLLKESLESLGVKVRMTRNSDEFIRLGSRVSLSNLVNPDVFISLHYNSFPEIPTAKGISTYYYDEKTRPLAQSIQKHLLLSSKANDRDVLYEDLQVLRHNLNRAVLIELGFISNQEEEGLLKTNQYQELLVEGIVNGLYDYFTR